MFQALIDRSRVLMDRKTNKTIVGLSASPPLPASVARVNTSLEEPLDYW